MQTVRVHSIKNKQHILVNYFTAVPYIYVYILQE